MFEEIIIENRTVLKYSKNSPEYLLIQFVDESDEKGLPEEIGYIETESLKRFAFAGIRTVCWNDELSPWEAEAVFGRQGFGGEADKSLEFLIKNTDEIKKEYGMKDSAAVILGGYSLSGLFALWAGYETDIFNGIAAVSPSLWFDKWMDFIADKEIKSKAVYLSLGDEEAKTKNKRMAEVEKCIKMQYNRLSKQKSLSHILEWNRGGHFKDAAFRMAKGFAWNLNSI